MPDKISEIVPMIMPTLMKAYGSDNRAAPIIVLTHVNVVDITIFVYPNLRDFIKVV